MMGVTYQAIQRLEKVGLNRMQALALAAIERGLPPWEPTEQDRIDAENPIKEDDRA
jgi:hypothetical protein